MVVFSSLRAIPAAAAAAGGSSSSSLSSVISLFPASSIASSSLSSVISFISNNRITGLSILAVGAVFFYAINDKPEKNKEQTRVEELAKKESAYKKSAVVDSEFWQKLWKLIQIAVPSYFSRESAYLLILACVLVIRTVLSIKVTEINGQIVQAIVKRDFLSFISKLAVLGSIAIPASTVNSMLKYLRGKLSLCFRERLVRYFHDRYLKNKMFYSVLNLDSRISTPDQALTETIDKWGQSLSQLYSDITKPLLDIVLFSAKITQVIGPLGPLSVVSYYVLSGIVIKLVSPRFGLLTAQTQKLEGSFRYCHHRLITSAEEIAFYGGESREKEIINNKFHEVVLHQAEFYRKSLGMGVIDGFLTKYGAVMLGYGILGLPVFGPGSIEYNKIVASDPAQITRDYIRNSGLLINLAQAIGRIVTSYKELQKLAGFTSLVSELDDVLTDLSHGSYQREMLTHTLPSRYAPGAGIMIEDDSQIGFDDAPLITPNGDVLVESVTFHVKRGENLMIVGPNGCGKSSLFRILGGLWPLWGGTVYKPSSDRLFYIPQKPYLTSGTLRDQVIYPKSIVDMAREGLDDTHLLPLLSCVHLTYLVERPGGWDAEEEWADVLSGGEKQRIAMARLFFHKPYFAILDECTSAVSVDVEGFMYRHCRELGITLVTISHRSTLWQYHDYLLRFEDQPTGLIDGKDKNAIMSNGVKSPMNGKEKSEFQKAKRIVTFKKMDLSKM